MATRKIGIIGYGEAGKQIEYFIREDNDQELLFIYFDDHLFNLGVENAYHFTDFDNSKFSDLEFYIGLGYNHLGVKRELCQQILSNGFKLPSLIHKTAYLHASAQIGNGIVIYPMCNIGFDVTLSDGVHINNSSVVSHNSFVGKATFISTGVFLSGFVDVGNECFIGTGTIVANGLKIGNRVKTGIGTVVTKDIADNQFAIGNPFRIIERLAIK